MGQERILERAVLFDSEPTGARVLVTLQPEGRAPIRKWLPGTPGELNIPQGSQVEATFKLKGYAPSTIRWQVNRDSLMLASLSLEQSEIRHIKAPPEPKLSSGNKPRRRRKPRSPKQARAEADYLRGIDAEKRGAPKSAGKFLRRALKNGLSGRKAREARKRLKRLVAPDLDSRSF